MKQHLKITIKAQRYYRVQYANNSISFCTVYDGDRALFNATARRYQDFVEEVLQGENEAAVHCETFITRMGNKFVYWRDEENDSDYISKVVEL